MSRQRTMLYDGTNAKDVAFWVNFHGPCFEAKVKDSLLVINDEPVEPDSVVLLRSDLHVEVLP